MSYDFKPLLTVAPDEAKPLLDDFHEAEWARYGRNVHAMMNTPRFKVAINQALLLARGAGDVERRIITFLTTGTIAS